MFCFLKKLFGFSNHKCCEKKHPKWKFEAGAITLCHGHHEVFVHLNAKPCKIWINPCTSCCIPVCQGDVNMFGVHNEKHGFVLIADITTDQCEVEWVAEF